MPKKIVAVLITFAVFLAAIGLLAYHGNFASADNTPAVIYIKSEADWESFIASSATQDYKDKTIVLATDLYFYSRNQDAGLPINNVKKPFEGTFEGNGHTLAGLSYAVSTSVFYEVGAGGVVRNLNIADLDTSGSGNAGGVATTNFGLIENVCVQGKINGALAGGIAHTNKVGGRIIGCTTAVEFLGSEGDFGSIAYANVGEIAYNYNIFLGEQVVYNFAVLTLPADTLIDDGQINSYYELFYLIDNPETAAALANDINLYSQDLSWLNAAVDADVLGDYYFYNNTCYDAALPVGFAKYTLPAASPAADDLIISGTGVESDPYVLFARGFGTLAQPFVVQSMQDLQKIQYLYANQNDWESFGLEYGAKLYFWQAADITLAGDDGGADSEYYDISIAGFGGTYDGGGRSVSCVIDSLFESVTQDGIVTNLNIRGEVRTSGEGLLAKDNHGILANIFVKGEIAACGADGKAGGIVYNNYGIIWLCEAQIDAAGIGEYGAIAYNSLEEDNANRIISTRSYSGGLPFAYSATGANIFMCYNGGNIWIGEDGTTAAFMSVSEYGGAQQYAGFDPYELLDRNIPNSGWKWASTAVNMLIGDMPYELLVATMATKRLWCVPGGVQQDYFVLRRPQDNIRYKTTGWLDFAGDHAYSKRPYKPEGYTPIVSAWFAAELPAGQFSYKWTFTDVFGNPEGILHDGGFENPIDCGMYRLSFMLDSTEEHTMLINEAVYEIERLTLSYKISDLMVKNTQTHSFDYIAGITNYAIENRTVTVGEYTYIINADGISINGDFYPYGGEQTAVTYNSSEYNVSSLKPFFAPNGAATDYTITEYRNAKGVLQEITPGFVRDAGTYKLDLTIRCDNYTDSKINGVIISVKQKNAGVIPYINTPDRKLPYGAVLNDYAAYSIDANDIYEPLTLGELTTMANPVSNYTKGSAAGSYIIEAIVGGNISNNYKAIGKTAAFEVVKINIADVVGYSDIALDNKTVVYDGKYQSLEASGLSGSFGVKYYYNGNPDASAFRFIDADSYSITAEVFIKNPDGTPNTNYNPAPNKTAVLTISPKHITVTVKSYTINFGDTVPAFALEDYSSQIVTRDDHKTDSFGNPEFVCGYPASGKAGGYLIGLSGITHPNYNLTTVSGLLTVNKISRGTLGLANPNADYNGTIYSPVFAQNIAIEIAALSPENITYYIITGDGRQPLSGKPKNAGSYAVVINFSATDTNIAETLEAGFVINVASIAPVFTLNGIEGRLYNSTVPISDFIPEQLTYNGLDRRVAVNGLPVNEDFIITFGYILDGIAADIPPDKSYFEFRNAGKYMNIWVSISGNPNYHGITLYGGSIEYKPKVLRLNSYGDAIYNTQAIQPSLSIRNADTEVMAGDLPTIAISYTAYMDEAAIEIKNAGAYLLKVSVGNANYVVLNDGNNNEFVPFLVKKYNAVIDFANDSYQTEYGRISSTFNKETTYYVYGYQETRTLTYNVAVASGVGVYNVLSVNATINVTFDFVNGEKKYIVMPKEVSFVLGLDGSYVYNGTARTDIRGKQIRDIDVRERLGNDVVGVRLSFDKDIVRDVGQYTVTAAVSNPNYKLADNVKTFTFAITKAELTISVNDITIDYLSQVPQYTAVIEGLAGEDTAESINLNFICAYRQGSAVGSYTIMPGQLSLDNYLCDISGAEGTLTVLPLTQTGIKYDSLTVVYNGKKVYYYPSGADETAEITVDGHPVDAGEYTLTATVERKNYITLTISCTLTIAKAVPTVETTDASVKYEADGRSPDSGIIVASAKFGDSVVAGHFVFEGGQVLRIGENMYTAEFVSEDQNFQNVQLSYKITAAIDSPQDYIEIKASSGKIENDTIYCPSSTIRVYMLVDTAIAGGIVMYANGAAVRGGVLELSDGSPTLLLEIKKDDVVVYSKTYGVLYDQKPTDPNNGGGNGNNGGGTTVKPQPIQKGFNYPLAGGIAGGVAALIILGIIIAKLAGRKGG